MKKMLNENQDKFNLKISPEFTSKKGIKYKKLYVECIENYSGFELSTSISKKRIENFLITHIHAQKDKHIFI